MLGRPGMRSIVIGCYPNGTLAIQPEDDAVWAALAERDIPLTIHVALSRNMPGAHKAKLPGYGRFFDAPNRMIEMIFAGVFDRFPKLDVFFAEVDFGWVPYVKEQIDNNYNRLEPVSKFGLKQARRATTSTAHFHFGYMTDTFGLQNRARMSAPSASCGPATIRISAPTGPIPGAPSNRRCPASPRTRRNLILHGNAERLFKFG